jgi:hypothetical protein
LRASGALGRSDPIQKLFEFLFERSRAGFAPKEIEVAEAVFGRRVSFDVAQDSTVRVYVHRLRRKLDDFYAGPGRAETIRLAIPKGEYRLVALSADSETAADAGPLRRGLPSRPALPWLLIAIAILLASNLIAGGLWWRHHTQESFAYATHNPAWAPLLKDQRPITLVVGDYYIFGEADSHAEVVRLIREYAINSPEDLSNYLMEHPSLVGKYTDLNLHYLPISIASALRSIMPIMGSTPLDRERVRVITASELTPDMLKRNNIVYVGYISGLGLLRNAVFTGSRFRVGETYDELIDQTTGKSYVSQDGGPDYAGETRKDYGYFATFTGPQGNRIVIVAGTRDVGVMQTAEAVSSREELAQIKDHAKGSTSFEALYQVEGVSRVNLRGDLITLSPLKPKAWELGDTKLHFPTD